jgi:single-strand DNA-binding protein
MANLNKVILMGNLTRDPELRYTPNGTAVATFGLAINRRYRQGEEWRDDVCFIDVVVWGRMAEVVSDYLGKGSLAMVEGRLQFRTWETPEGNKRSKHEVVADNVQFLPRGQGNRDEEAPFDTPMYAGPGAPEESDDVPF